MSGHNKKNSHVGHGHDHEGGSGLSGSGTLLLVVLFNAVITAAEYIGGILSGSLALVSDAGHNLSDVMALILGYAGERASRRNPDERFSFGLKRMEVLVALINGVTLVFIGIYIVYESVKRYIDPVPIDIRVMIPVAAIGLAGNLLSIFFLSRGRDKNLNIRAAFLHLLYDAFSSIAVIAAGVILYFTGLLVVDLAISLFIVFMIFWGASGVIRETVRIFLQATPSEIDSRDVYSSILSTGGVESIHGLHIWSINSNEVFLSCHICLSGGVGDTDGIIREINSMLDREYSITHTTIQVERDRMCGIDGSDCCR
ncbi:MAG: cation diffusion facilitator family transporter [Spirochaetes bacterium]|jgi:cobalt-zinc-cadmium efflux system protein|nr:cation diffusion facilitator family transporter [Spirochaetota bacterium]